MEAFWADSFYPNLLEGRGIAGRTDACVHSGPRYVKLAVSLLKRMGKGDSTKVQRNYTRKELREANSLVSEAFSGRWENLPEELACILRRVLPNNIVNNVIYDLKRDPSKYVRKHIRK